MDVDSRPPNAVDVAIPLIERPSALKVIALCSSPHSGTHYDRSVIPGPWRHPSELRYIDRTDPAAAEWDDYTIVSFLVRSAISVPPRSDSRSDPWVVVSNADSGTTTLPRGYRVPILWLMKVQWESLRLLLTVARPLWDVIKYDLLHISRLTTQFLAHARAEEKMKRQWRDPMFDRPLTRFFNGWLGCRDVFAWDFYREFREEEYKDDMLARRWAQKVPKGIQGFIISEQELLDGITAEQLMAGLKTDAATQTFKWDAPPELERPPTPPVEPEPASAPVPWPQQQQDKEPSAASHSRGSSPLTSDMGSEVDMIAESLNPKLSEPSTPVASTSPPLFGPPPLLAIQTAPEQLQRRKSAHKLKPLRTKVDRPEKSSSSGSRPIRTRTMSGSVSGMSPATPKIAHLAGASAGPPSASVNGSPSALSMGFDFTAPVESRGRKRKIESVYSVSPSPLTSDEEDGEGGSASVKGSSRKNSDRWKHSATRPESATPDGRGFTTHSRIVIPRLANPEMYSRPQTQAYTAPFELPPLTGGASASASVSHPVRRPSIASTTDGMGGPASAGATAAGASGSISAPSPRKRDPKPPSSTSPVPIHHYKLYTISSSPSTHPWDPSNPIPPFHTWRHPEELDYIGPTHSSAGEWNDFAIVAYMVENAFTIPSRTADNRQTWVEVRMPNKQPEPAEGADGSAQTDAVVSVTLPRGYRIPLLWLGRVQWDCLQQLLTPPTSEYWDALKFDMLHLARLSAVFLAKARKEPKIKRQYRDVMFDRALSRFFVGWMGSRDEFVYDFFREFRDEEYEDDMLQRRWLQKAVKGIQGFALPESELNEGISAEQFIGGLKLDREKGTFHWEVERTSAAALESESEPVNAAVAPAQPQLEQQVEAAPIVESAQVEPQPQPQIESVVVPAPVPEDVPMEMETETPDIVEPSAAAQAEVDMAATPRAPSPLSLSQIAGADADVEADAHLSPPSPLTPDMQMQIDNMDIDQQPPTRAAPDPELQPVGIPGVPTPPPSEPDQEQVSEPSAVAEAEPSRTETPQVDVDAAFVQPDVPSDTDVRESAPDPADLTVVLSEAPSAPVETIPAPVPVETAATNEAPPDEVVDARVADVDGPGSHVEVQMDAADEAAAVVTLAPERDLSEHPFDVDGTADTGDESIDGMDDMDTLDVLDMDFLQYPPSKPSSPHMQPPSDAASAAIDEIVGELLYPPLPEPTMCGSTPTLAVNGSVDLTPEDDVEFDETEYIRSSRMQSPFGMTPPPPSQLGRGQLAKSPLVEAPVIPPVEEPSAEPETGQPFDLPAEEKVEEPADEIAEPLEDKTVEQPDDEPFVDDPEDAPPLDGSEQPVQPPVDETGEQPEENFVDQSVPERVPSARSMSPQSDSESIRSSSSPEPRGHIPLDEPLPEQSRETALPDALSEERSPSPPPDSEEDEEEEAAAGGQELIAADPPADSTPEPEVVVENTEPASVETYDDVSTVQVGAAHVLPLSAADAAEDFPPGFHFMGGVPHGQPLLSARSPPEPVPAFQAQTPPPEAETASDIPVADGLHVRPTADSSRASPSINGRVRTPTPPINVDEITVVPPSTSAGPATAETMLSNLSPTDDSRRVKLEIMTVSLNNGEDEVETDMDMGTPIEMDLDDTQEVLSIPATANSSQISSPPLGARQTLSTPDATFHTVAAPSSAAAAAAAAPPISTPPISTPNNDYMLPPGFSRIGSAPGPPNDSSLFRASTNAPAPSHQPPPLANGPPERAAPSSHRGPFTRLPPPSTQNMPNLNHAPESPGGNFMNGGSRPSPLYLHNKPPTPHAPSVARRPDVQMDGTNDSYRSPIRIPDASNEYDPRRRESILPGPSSSYPMNGSMPSPSIPPAPAYQRWMGYSGPGSAAISSAYHQPYSPLVSLNPVPPQALPPSPSPRLPHSTNGPVAEPVGARPPSRQVNRTPEVGGRFAPQQSMQQPIQIPATRLPSPPQRSFSNDSIPHLPPRPPSPLSRVGIPLTAVGRKVAPPEGLYTTKISLPQFGAAPEVEMGETSPRRRSPSPPPASRPPAHALPESTSSAPEPITRPPSLPPSPALVQAARAPEIDMRTLENTLVERLKGELRSQLKNELRTELGSELRGELKGEFRSELRDELRGELRNELRGELTDELNRELGVQMQQHQLSEQMKLELFGELKQELLAQMKGDLLLQLKDELFTQMKAELLTHIKGELMIQLKDDLLSQLKGELVRQLQEELLVLLQDKLKVSLADDLTASVKNNLREQLRADMKDDIILELKDHYTAQLQEQLKGLLVQLTHAVNTTLRNDNAIQLKYFIAKLKEELLSELRDTLTVHVQNELIAQVTAALTAQLRDGLGAQREQLNLDFERRRLFLEQQPRAKAAVKSSSPVVSTPSRATPITPKPLPSLLFQQRHPLHHLVLTNGSSDPTGMDVDTPNPPPTPPPASASAPASPSKPKNGETPLPVKSQRKQSWFTAGYQASTPA